MIFEARYDRPSRITNELNATDLAFSTNTLREATYFEGEVAYPRELREGLAALYAVVVSDFRYHPKDRLEFRAWLEEQDRKFLANLGVLSEATRREMELLEARLRELDQARDERLAPFYRARRAFFDHVYENEYELAYLLDPVITVHPDELSFEAFSRDESSYARLAASYELFGKVGAFECGTTNIDFSSGLHNELQRMRSYRRTRFDVAPSGFTAGGHKEKKIPLPESWVNGFLQVHSVMTMGLTHFVLEPIDLYNLCRFLTRHKARQSPRALRYELVPGEPVKAVLEPWEHVLILNPDRPYEGPKPQSIRTWGRDRLKNLAHLLPVCRKVDVYLAGFGLPSIYEADLGPLRFTLALSGWTDNDWTGQDRFALLTRKANVNADELSRVYERLRKDRLATESQLAQHTGLDLEKTRSALSYLCQVGRAMRDLKGGLYRHRDLFHEPFSASAALAQAEKAAEESNPHAKAAKAILQSDNVRMIARRPVSDGFKLSGSAKGLDGQRVRPLVHLDFNGTILDASCSCKLFEKHKLTQGPCEHILALRLLFMQGQGQES